MSSQLYMHWTCDKCQRAVKTRAAMERRHIYGLGPWLNAPMPMSWASVGTKSPTKHLCDKCNPLADVSDEKPPSGGPFR